jgi:hypothetical protein
MANPRNAVGYQDIDFLAITQKTDNSTILFSATTTPGLSAQAGLATTWSADDTQALTADANGVAGKLILVDADNPGGANPFCTVQVEGFCQLPGGNAAALTRGKHIVGALGAASARGYIRDVATAAAAELGVQNHTIWNVADTTAVWVKLG